MIRCRRRATTRGGLPTAILAAAGTVAVLGACGGDGSTGPVTAPRDGRIVFLDPPPDALVGRTLPPLRVEVQEAGGRRALYVDGPVEIAVSGATGEHRLTGRRFYDLVRGEALLHDLAVDAPGSELRLSASWRDLVGTSSTFAVVEGYDAVRLPDDAVEAAVYVEAGNNWGEPVWGGARADRGVARAGLLRRAPTPAPNRVLAFAKERAPSLAPDVAWTAGVDTVDVALGDPTPIHLTVWLLDGTTELFEPLVLHGLVESEELWARERVGLVVGLLEIVDARRDPDVPGLLSQDATAAWMEDLKRRIGERSGRINVYAVPKVRRDGRSFTGVAELGGNAIALSPGGWTGATLAHEIGHNLGLGHVDGLEGFDEANLMYSRAGRRAFVSEGQIARMHFAPGSALVGVLGFSAAAATETAATVAEETLPPLALRLWADGELSATSVSRGAARPVLEDADADSAPAAPGTGLRLGPVVVPAPQEDGGDRAAAPPPGAECLVLDPGAR